MADERVQVRFHATASPSWMDAAHMYWNSGRGSRPITWIGQQPSPRDEDVIRQRVEALKKGETQWGHDGAHHGRPGDPECPGFLHHHHDYRCALPTEDECARANVEYRTTWASRA